MTTSSTAIRPRLRTRSQEVEAAPEPAAVPDRLLLPRVLIRVPHLSFGQPIAVAPTSAAPVATAKNVTAPSASTSVETTPEELAAAAEKDSIFNTLWSQATTFVPAKYLKLMGIALLALGGLWALHGRGHHAAHETPGTDAPAWSSPVAAQWSAQSAPANLHPSAAPATPWNSAPQIGAQAPATQFADGRSAAAQMPAGLVPTGPFATGGMPAADASFAGGSASATRGDSIPSMSARDPSWGTAPSRDSSPIAQNGPPADGYRTAQRFDPTTVPAGRGEATQPGVARFQGGISAPPGDGRQ